MDRVVAGLAVAAVATAAFLVPSTAKSVTRPYEPPPVVLTDEEYIRSQFQDDPTMVEIALAEAYDYRDRVPGVIDCAQKNPASSATGCFQILRGTWQDHACVGDPWDREDNVECAKRLRAANGHRDWLPSAHVWGEQPSQADHKQAEQGELHGSYDPGVEPAEQDDQSDDRHD